MEKAEKHEGIYSKLEAINLIYLKMKNYKKKIEKFIGLKMLWNILKETLCNAW